MPHFDYGYFRTNKKVKNIRKKLLLSRTIKKKILANDFSYDYYDGDRENGYGGFKYDGRWKKFLIKIIKKYKLNKNSRVLDISAKKGFFMHDLTLLVPGIKVYGVEDHKYPIITSMKSVKGNIKLLKSYCDIDYKKDFFDFVHAHNAIYRYSFRDLIKIIKIISKISKKAHITIPSYSNNLDRVKFLDWSLHGGVLLTKKEWRELFKNLGYKFYYYFSGAKNFRL